ncbi:MAG TPA: hypothetical protein VEH09_09825 [Thermodesulfobacteriota bacterium]|nr:hypothetical protein [Thermodesulfobacteriota bacterium]
MKNRLPKKIGLWAFGLACGVICLSCASSSPKTGGLSPNLGPAPASRDTMPPPPQALSSSREAPLSRSEPVPASPKPAPQGTLETKPKPSYVHTVKWSGETVSIIAGWYTGNIENWKAVVQANPNIKVYRISAGNKIFIPENLMKTREPMPKEFVDRFYSKPRKEKARPTPQTQLTQTKEEEPTLIGPKKSVTK